MYQVQNKFRLPLNNLRGSVKMCRHIYCIKSVLGFYVEIMKIIIEPLNVLTIKFSYLISSHFYFIISAVPDLNPVTSEII